MASPIVTLLTDFGLTDTYVGQMRGVIAGIAPGTTVIDLTHDVAPYHIQQGAVLLADAVEAFPPGTIHVAVVDPGVGSARRAVAAEIGPWTFVGPDNGLFTVISERCYEQPTRIVELTKPRYWREMPPWCEFISNTFHGRDLFAPVAAHLSLGLDLDEVGHRTETPLVALPLPRVENHGDLKIRGEVLYADQFGNLCTNIFEMPDVFDGRHRVQIGSSETIRIVSHYAKGEPGELIALVNSSRRLELAVVGGSAAHRLQAGAGYKVTVLLKQP